MQAMEHLAPSPGVPTSSAPGAEWVGTLSLTLYHTAAHVDQPQPAPSQEHCCLHQNWLRGISWNTHTRKLVNQSHGHFMTLQVLASQEKARGGEVSAEDLVHYSRLYRAALHECVLGLRSQDQGCHVMSSEEEDEEQRGELAAFYAMLELAWHLCEVLFIEVLPAGCLIQQLMEWVQHNGRSEEEALSGLLATPTPEEHKDYWRVLYHLVMRGQLSEASKLLQHHSRVQTHPIVFASMEEVLLTAPMLASTAGVSRAELHRRWNEWKKQVKYRLEAGDYLPFLELQLLAKVMCGEESAFMEPEILLACDSWYELMVGRLLYTDPLVTSQDYELSYSANWSRKTWQATPTMEWDMDKLLDAALRHDYMEIITISSSKLTDWWFVAHLANLFQHKGILTQQRLESAPELCEFLLVEYSSVLMTLQSLWQVGLDYLSHCPAHGRHYMGLLVERIPLTTERKANKVIHLCQRYHLKDQIKSVCKVLAMKAYKNKRLGAALTWCIKGKDSAFAAFLVEEYMESFDSLGEFMDLDLLDHLGDAMLLNDKLLFLAKYREYHLLYEKGHFVESGNLLISLLISNSVPRRFVFTLLKDALGLLHKQELVFSSAQIYTLSHYVLQLTMTPSDLPSSGPTPFIPPPTTDVSSETATERTQRLKKLESDLLALLRLSLVKYLGRALMEESSH